MINDRMKLYDVETRQTGKNEYGEPLTGYDLTGTVEMSISLITKVINELDVRYLTSTHIGLTYDRTIKADMKISSIDDAYIVKIVNNDCRMSQITLEQLNG